VAFAESLSGVLQRLGNVCRFQVREFCDDLLGGHTVGDQGDDRGDGDPEATNGRNPACQSGSTVIRVNCMWTGYALALSCALSQTRAEIGSHRWVGATTRWLFRSPCHHQPPSARTW
jgi:hypothetical protein